MTVHIRAVVTAEEAQRVYRLRYDVYIEELGRTQRYADHRERAIREPLDEGALLLAAYANEQVVGTVRVNLATHDAAGDYVELYQMGAMGAAHPASTSFTTKLLVSAEHRNSLLASRLACAAYRNGLRMGVLHDFIDVYPARVPFFERFGYRVHVPKVIHVEFGEVIVMKLDMRDAAHLHRVRSPFRACLTSVN